jgi:hypothetical protein
MKSKERFSCPRCGELGYIEERRKDDHVYIYCVHVKSKGKKRKVNKCYLGALNYEYVEKFNPLGLSGLHDTSRFSKYIKKLIDSMDRDQLVELMNYIKQKVGE